MARKMKAFKTIALLAETEEILGSDPYGYAIRIRTTSLKSAGYARF